MAVKSATNLDVDRVIKFDALDVETRGLVQPAA